jgi:hypothetical protein
MWENEDDPVDPVLFDAVDIAVCVALAALLGVAVLARWLAS